MVNSEEGADKIHYGKEYFSWQKGGGETSSILDKWKFEEYTNNTKSILDFGCGGGFILDKLEAREKFGVEINPFAREEATKKGIKVFKSIDELPEDLLFDTIISNHALEHVHNPFDILQGLKKHLRKNGIIVFFLPFNDYRLDKEYDANDINKHLFTWSPLNIGNLFSEAGFTSIETRIIRKPWLPYGVAIKHYFPGFFYDFLAWLRSRMQRTVEIMITASA